MTQKYSDSSGVGALRHSWQTGTRVHSVSTRLQIRHSSGNNSEKMPWGIALKVEAAVLVKLLLEKAHLLFVPKRGEAKRPRCWRLSAIGPLNC